MRPRHLTICTVAPIAADCLDNHPSPPASWSLSTSPVSRASTSTIAASPTRLLSASFGLDSHPDIANHGVVHLPLPQAAGELCAQSPERPLARRDRGPHTDILALPQAFLRVVSLRTATEFITFTLLINKVTGFYGILALFTGYHLNPLQLSHYIYSLLVLALGIWLAPAIRDPSRPLRTIALAWLYVIDSVINTAYTVLFGLGWFVLLAQHLNEDIAVSGKTGKVASAGGKGTMSDTAGFTDPQVPDAVQVDVVASPAKDSLAGQDAVAYASTTPVPLAPGSLHEVVMQPDSLTSIILLALFGLIRVYFCLIILSYARNILRGYIASTGGASTASGYADAAVDASMAENPFRTGSPDASRLGRLLTAFPSRRYWLGRDEYPAASASEWERLTHGRFEAAAKKDLAVKAPSVDLGGPSERERRARSGTGPSPAELVGKEI